MIPYGASDTGTDAWAFQLLDYILHPDYQGDPREPTPPFRFNGQSSLGEAILAGWAATTMATPPWMAPSIRSITIAAPIS